MQPERLNAALGYAQRGWRVLALSPGEKIPVSDKKLQPHGSKSASKDPEHITALFHLYPLANVGIATGEESFTVVDLDKREAETNLKAVGLIPPKTMTVRTPRGLHLYIEYDKRIKQTAGLLDGVDIRGTGGYVVAPPSSVNGTVYEFAREVPILAWPELAEFAAKPPIGSKAPKEQYETWVSELLTKGASQPGRDQACTRLAGYFRAFGTPRDIALAILKDFAAKCDPPFPEADVLKKVASVWRYEQVRPASYKGQTLIGPQVDKSITGRLRFMWASEDIFIEADRIRERKEGISLWLTITVGAGGVLFGPVSQNILLPTFDDRMVKQLSERHEANWRAILQHVRAEVVKSLEETTRAVDMVTFQPSAPSPWIAYPFVRRMQPNIIFGHGSSGKTTLGAALSISIASGIPLLPRVDIREKGNVLYLDWETDDEEFATVRDALLAHVPEAAASLSNEAIIYRRLSGPLESQIDRVIKDVVDHDISTVFYDSLGKAVATNINEPDAPRVFYQCVGATGCSAVVFTHISSESVVRKGSEIRPFGSVYWWDYGRNNWFLKASQEPGEKSLRVGLYHSKINRGRKLKPYGYEMTFEEDDEQNTIGIYYQTRDVREDEVLAEGTSLKERILYVLKRGPQTAGEIAESLNHDQNRTRSYLNKPSYRDRLWMQIPNTNQWTLISLRDTGYAGGDVTSSPPKGGREPLVTRDSNDTSETSDGDRDHWDAYDKGVAGEPG